MSDLILCTRCNIKKEGDAFNNCPTKLNGKHSFCKICQSAADKKRRLDNPGVKRDKALQAQYGITHQDYKVMLAGQNGRCALCKTDWPGGPGKHFHIDHCHRSGKIRALLCSKCNVGLGHFNDDPTLLQNAIAYLENHA